MPSLAEITDVVMIAVATTTLTISVLKLKRYTKKKDKGLDTKEKRNLR